MNLSICVPPPKSACWFVSPVSGLDFAVRPAYIPPVLLENNSFDSVDRC